MRHKIALARTEPARGVVPFLSALALMFVLSLLSPRADREASAVLAPLDLDTAIDGAPYRIGLWSGTDVEVPEAAIEMLRPSVILSRGFRHLEDDRTARVLIVRCSDARDMMGHFPPRCYPALGWVADRESTDATCTVNLGSRAIELRLYRFSRMDVPGHWARLRVHDFFVRPDGTTSADRPRLNYIRQRYAGLPHGLTQVQVIFSGPDPTSPSHETEVVRELLEGHVSLLGLSAEGAAQ